MGTVATKFTRMLKGLGLSIWAIPLKTKCTLSLLVSAALVLTWLFWLPDVESLRSHPPKSTAYIDLRRAQAAARGRPFKLQWQWISYANISEDLKRAVVTAEDDTFWTHNGVDWDAIRQAWSRNLKAGRIAAGGSTITMQLSRNLYLSPSKNPLRKAKEILIARKLERVLGKRRILELYLNVAEWGKGVFGCEAAAQAYFEKSCSQLSAEEAVAMAVVLPNPRRWDPSKRGVYVERNARRIIGRMAAVGWWSSQNEIDENDPAIIENSSTENGAEKEF